MAAFTARNRKVSASFDDELIKLRQRLNSAPRAPAATAAAAGSGGSSRAATVGGGRSGASSEVVEWLGGVSNGDQHASALPSSGSSFLSLLARSTGASSGSVSPPPLDPVDARLSRIRHALQQFEDTSAAISEFTYNEEEEADRVLQAQLRAGGRNPQALPRFFADSFDFNFTAPRDGAAAAASGMNRRPEASGEAPGAEGQIALRNDERKRGPESTAAASTVQSGSISAVSVLQREAQRQQAQRQQLATRIGGGTTAAAPSRSQALYDLPEDLAARHGVKPSLEPASRLSTATRAQQNSRRGAATAGSSTAVTPTPPRGSSGATAGSIRSGLSTTANGSKTAAESATAPPPPELDFSSVTQMKYRAPATVTSVADGAIAFCRECHRVIIGSGPGRCPHCGTLNDSEAAASPTGGKTTSDAAGMSASPLTSPSRHHPPRVLPPDASLADIEAEERRLFQIAVSEWRRGGAGPAVTSTAAEASNGRDGSGARDGMSATKFEVSVARAAQYAGACAARDKSRLYFSALWAAAFPQ
jgi:hypothetical protein